MANRGMLPKFRPATLGGREASLRPLIRPLKPSAPPPPPTPPQRRFSSGIEASPPPTPFIDGHPDLLTPSFADPPTMAAARERVHAIARELPRSEQRFDDETQARPADEVIADRWSPHRRAEIASQNVHGGGSEMDVPYDALPSLNQPSDFPPPPRRDLGGVWNDDDDANDGDPSTQMRPEDRDRMGVDRFQDDSYNHNRREASYRGREDSHEQERGYDRDDEDEQQPRREESYRPPQDSFEADSFAGYGREQQHGNNNIRNEDSFSAAPQAQKFGSTAAWGAAEQTDDSGPRARGGSAPRKQPQYDVAAYEAHYPSSRRNDRDGNGESYRERASFNKRADERVSYGKRNNDERASYKRSDEGPSQIGYQPTQQANLGDYPMPDYPPAAPEPAESSRRERTYAPPAQQAREESYRARKVNVQVYDDSPQIPQAPAVPHDMMMPGMPYQQPQAAQYQQQPAGFVMGVQPIRGGNTPAPAPRGGFPIDQFPPAHVVAAPRMGTPNMGVGVPYNAAPSTMAASPRAMMPNGMGMTPMGGMHAAQMNMHMGMTPMGVAMATPPPPAMHVRAASARHNPSHYAGHAGPVGHQLQMTEVEEAQQGSKVGRFAWFVFGAAFGIFFAFFATGFVPRLGKNKEAEFPQPPPIPQPVVQQQQPQIAPPQPAPRPQPAPVQIQAPPPAVAVVQPPVVQPAPPPAVAPAPAPTPVIAQASPPPKVAPAPPPAAPRGSRAGSIARRATPAPAPAPKNLPSSSRDDDDDRPPPPKKAEKKSGDIGDLLNAGLGD